MEQIIFLLLGIIAGKITVFIYKFLKKRYLNATKESQ
jgi:ABC-type Co2+ transport system permease subunit